MTEAERDEELRRVISDYGIANAADCVQAHHHTLAGLNLSDCLALLENESTGRNIFGGEGSACPSRWYEGPVTRYRYTIYKVRRNLGMSPNGVGPTQLTDPGLQKEAEKAGGCWKPYYNMIVGFHLLRELQQQHGREEGFRAYNGSGPAAVAYGARAIERAQIWHDRFVRLGLA